MIYFLHYCNILKNNLLHNNELEKFVVWVQKEKLISMNDV
jgi:hypothetical protein